jgi:choline-sulfatase
MSETQDRPNILLVMTDQQRGDALGIENHPVLHTPHLDHFAADGAHFRSAYSACPVCVPARRTLMTGRRPASQGVLMNYPTRLEGPTLPQALSEAGYQTALCGKLHIWPMWKRHGFEHFAYSDGPFGHDDDYQRFLRREGIRQTGASTAHGVGPNATPVRPWHLDEQHHFTNWCVTEALDFLERRDPTRPFFLNVSFIHPHQPYTPPRFYHDRYMQRADEIPDPVVGDWAHVYSHTTRGIDPRNTWRLNPDRAVMREMRAGYYACIQHIDEQIGRLWGAVPRNTIIVFCSDHGEMLGDHQWLRKRTPFEGSARVPLAIHAPGTAYAGTVGGRTVEEPVELMDLMPTLLEAAGAPIPDTVEGRSLFSLLRGDGPAWRDAVHGECSNVATANSGMQYLTNGKRKYIWWPGLGQEQFFDLERDPEEREELAATGARASEIAAWRQRLIETLADRPEGFVRGGELARLDGPTPPHMPGFEQPSAPV